MNPALRAVASGPYVEEDQEAQGTAPSVEGQPRQASQHGSRLILLTSLRLVAPLAPWERLGFSFSRSGSTASFVVAGLRFDFVSGSPSDGQPGLCGWGFELPTPSTSAVRTVDGIETFVDSVATNEVGSTANPLGIVGVDHVVVMTPKLDRTCGAITEHLGLPLKRIREVGGGVRQGFHRAGSVILEVVERPDIAADEPARLWGLVFNVADLDAVVEQLGPDVIGAPRDAVQKGRRIATVRSEAGLGCPLALMTPDIRDSH